MVELARALATEPEMLLLDEPASGLNTRKRKTSAVLIRKIRDRGITILLVEHDMSVVMGLSDDILVLHNGCRHRRGRPGGRAERPESHQRLSGRRISRCCSR